MSGGSHNYLCHADASDIFNKREDIKDMVYSLTSMGYLDAAKETEKLLLDLDAIEVRLNAKLERLGSVWRDVEWIESGDGADIEKTIKDYRNE